MCTYYTNSFFVSFVMHNYLYKYFYTVILVLNVLIITHHVHQWMAIILSLLLTALSVTTTVHQMGMSFTYYCCYSYMCLITYGSYKLVIAQVSEMAYSSLLL